MTCAAAALLPVPVFAVVDPSGSADIACAYLGLASAWVAAEVFRAGGLPGSRAAWAAKTAAVAAAVGVNLAVFVVMGLAAGVRTALPFPLMAAMSAAPAVGLVPWLVMRVRRPYGALVLAAAMLLAAKLAACVVVRIVYGPDALAAGYMAGDWHSARLMISLFWAQALALSIAGLVMGYCGAKDVERPQPVGTDPGRRCA
jgi:hypothetical protein